MSTGEFVLLYYLLIGFVLAIPFTVAYTSMEMVGIFRKILFFIFCMVSWPIFFVWLVKKLML